MIEYDTQLTYHEACILLWLRNPNHQLMVYPQGFLGFQPRNPAIGSGARSGVVHSQAVSATTATKIGG